MPPTQNPSGDLFGGPSASPPADDSARPLADRMRPVEPDQFVGQEHLLAAGRPLGRLLESGRAHSMILWGPPGTGKTTLARVVAGATKAQFITINAVLSGVGLEITPGAILCFLLGMFCISFGNYLDDINYWL